MATSHTIAQVLELAEAKPEALGSAALGALRMLEDAAGHAKNGTAKAWFKAHHGDRVDTVMSQPGSIWTPQRRLVDSGKLAGEVLLNGSHRGYAGLTVLHADADTLLVSYDFNGPSWAIYTVSQ